MAAPENRSLENVAKYLNPEIAAGDYALLDLGAGATRIDIFSKGVYEVTRSIDTGSQSIARLVADVFGCDPHKAELYIEENKDNILESEQCRDLYSRIAIDVMRAINYYTFENRDNTLEKMYYYGGGSKIKPLIEEIRETIQLELVPFSDVVDSDEITKDAVMNGAASAGICWNQ
jgi:type IV pilus assembly protein PilM